MQPVYISSAAAISPQESFDVEQLPATLHHSDKHILFVQDPNYRDFINPVAIRRMSRLLKRGISAGMKALQMAGLDKPTGIITGTGLGSMTDMEHFIKDLIAYNEEALNPTYFIQSTYNSINGWLALQTKCTGYNQTYVHRGHSLELSLLDAQMLLNETTERETYLVGGFDETTEEHVFIKNKKQYWKQGLDNTLDVLKHSDTIGTISGEGAAFFTITNNSDNAICSIKGIKMLNSVATEDIQNAIDTLLKDNGIGLNDIDLALLGVNGDSRHQAMYTSTTEKLLGNTSIGAFKHMCGEYETAVGFALWMATRIFATQQIHPTAIIKEGTSKAYNNILIVNHYLDCNASVMLLSR